MCTYIYGYRIEREDGEVFLKFPSLPEIITGIPEDKFDAMSEDEREEYALDAILTALNGYIRDREAIPVGDNRGTMRADGFVELPTVQGHKLQLYELFLNNCDGIDDLQQALGSASETSARRLLDLRHSSKAEFVEYAIYKAFGKKVEKNYKLVAA